MFRKLIVWVFTGVLGLAYAGSALAFFHLWRINEIYTNASGSVQFLELICSPTLSGCNDGEVFANGVTITVTPTGGSAGSPVTLTGTLTGPLVNKTLLLATSGFATVAGVTPDYTIPAGFIAVNGGTIRINNGSIDTVVYAALPTDGVLSINRGGATATNSPTNFAGVTGSVILPPDTTPDVFSFTPVTGAALSAVVESNTINVSGINAAAAISITGGEYSVNSGAYTATAGTVSNGSSVNVRLTASSSLSTAASATLTIGGVNATFTVTTAAFPGTIPQTGLRVWLKADTGLVLAPSTSSVTQWFDQSGNGVNVEQSNASKRPVQITSTPNGLPAVRFDGQDDYLQTVAPVTLLSGTSVSVFVAVRPGATQKDYADIVDYTHGGTTSFVLQQAASTTNQFYTGDVSHDLSPAHFQVYMHAFASAGAAISRLNGNEKTGTYSSITFPQPNYFTVGNKSLEAFPREFNGDIAEVIVYDRVLDGTERTAVETYLLGRYGLDTVPDPFSPDTLADVPTGSQQTSGTVTVAGINTAAPIAVSGGEYSINGAGFTTAPGLVSSGQQVQVRLTASASLSTTTSATLTIGGVNGTFQVTTAGDTTSPTVPGNFTATAVSSSQINLAWTASTDAVGVTAYQVFRGGVQIATLNSAALSYSDTGLTAATLYSYGVRGCDAAGNCSTQATASATTLVPGLVIGPSARTQFEGFRDGPTADTFIDFNTTPVGALSTQISGLTFQSNINTSGSPFGPINVYVSTAPQCTVRCIVGTPFTTGTDDGRVGYQILFATPQRRAGLHRNWLAQYSVTRFYNASGTLLAEHINTVNSQFVGYIAQGSNSATDWVARIQMDGLMNDGVTRQVGYSDDLFFGTAQAGTTFTPALELGFNLISNSLDITINVPATFGNQDTPVSGVTENVVTIWKWNATDGRWAFYAPQLSAAGIAAFAASKGYDVLSTINPGEGYWVNAVNSITLPAQTGTPFNWTPGTFVNLPTGFNLIAHTDDRTPSEFNVDVSPTPPAQGTVPTDNFLSLWVWDAVAAKWYFYSPLLESSGGLQAVKDYADSHFYLHFQDFNKKIGLGVGFWVNRP